MGDKFEINGILVEYVVENNTYYLTDISYAMRLGLLKLEEGPGWVFTVHATFLDGGDLGVISEMVNALNAELSDDTRSHRPNPDGSCSLLCTCSTPLTSTEVRLLGDVGAF